MILLIDNYDSFTYNLAQYLGELGAPPLVRRNDEITLDEIDALHPDAHRHLARARAARRTPGISVEVIRRFGPTTPVLGVCLGHQGIGIAFGGAVVRAPQLMHGKMSSVAARRHAACSAASRSRSSPARYHSLVVADPLPAELEVAARTDDGTIMGVRHQEFPMHGVQFHPESVLTGEGKQLLRNFLELSMIVRALLEKLQRREDLTIDEAAAAMDEIMDGRGAAVADRRAAGRAGDEGGAAGGDRRASRGRCAARATRLSRDVSRRCSTPAAPAAIGAHTFNVSTVAALVRRRRAACASRSTATDRCRAGAAAPTCSRRSASTSRRRRRSSSAASTRPASRSSSRRRSIRRCGMPARPGASSACAPRSTCSDR